MLLSFAPFDEESEKPTVVRIIPIVRRIIGVFLFVFLVNLTIDVIKPIISKTIPIKLNISSVNRSSFSFDTEYYKSSNSFFLKPNSS